MFENYIVSTQLDEIWKTTSFILKMEDGLIFRIWKTTSFLENGRQPKFFENER
jgi:hypothetical protein